MSFTHQIERTWKRGNDSVVAVETVTSDSEANQDVAVADGQTAFHTVLAIDVSQLKSLFIKSDQDITIKTNSSGSPTDTIDVVANIPLMWTPDCGFDCPLSADVTGLYIANDSGSTATVQIRCLQDGTP